MKQPIHMKYTEAISCLERDIETLTHNASIEDAPNNKEGLLACAGKIQDAITLLKLSELGGLLALVERVRAWGVDKGITGPNAKATVHSQFSKLLEEVDEVREGIEKKDQHEILDGIGDCTVVLILLAELAGFKFETALLAAYDVIKSRTGTMIAGKFVKNPITMEPQPDQGMCGYFVTDKQG